MAKLVADAVLDSALNYIRTNSAKLCVCSTQPTTYAHATSTYKLASASISTSDFGAAANDSSGRKVQVNAQSSVSIDSSGSAAHIALVTASALIYVTTCSSQALTASGTVNVPAWDINLQDPT